MTGYSGWLYIERVERGDVDEIAGPAGGDAAQCRERADRAVRPRRPLARCTAAHEWWPRRRAALHVSTAQRLTGEVGRRPVVPRTVESERTQRDDHQAGERRRASTRRARRIGGDRAARGPHDDLGPTDELARERGVADHAVTRRAQEAEERAVVVGRERCITLDHPAQRVTGGVFDLHHVGAAVGQQLGAVRTRQAARQVDDLHAGEGPRDAHPATVGQPHPSPVMPPPFPPLRIGGWLEACRSSGTDDRGVDVGPGRAASALEGVAAARRPGRSHRGRGRGGVGRRPPHRTGRARRGRCRPGSPPRHCWPTTLRSVPSNAPRWRSCPA